MPEVVFTSNLQRLVNARPQTVEAITVRDALLAVFEQQPELRGYVLDDQQRVRQHVMIFVDGQPLADRREQSDAVEGQSEIYVMQALSGG